MEGSAIQHSPDRIVRGGGSVIVGSDGVARGTTFSGPIGTGDATPAAGAFTTLSATGDLTVDSAGTAIVRIDRGTTGSYGILAFQTAGSDSWDLYVADTATPDMILYGYGINAAVMTFGYVTGASTFGYAATFSAELQMAGVDSPAQITGDVNDYATDGFSHLRLDADGAHDITGFAGGSAGKMLYITNISASTLTFNNEDAASAAANRIITGHAAPLTLTATETLIFMYDAVSSRWRVYGHHA